MPETPRIPELNDAFRKGEKAHLGRIMLTQGIRHSRGSRPLGDLAVHIKVQTFAASVRTMIPTRSKTSAASNSLARRASGRSTTTIRR